MDWKKLLVALVDTSALGGWVRAGVAGAVGIGIAKWPWLSTVFDPATQAALAGAAATIVVGVWSHVAKSMANGAAK
jgi:hypothetical protein